MLGEFPESGSIQPLGSHVENLAATLGSLSQSQGLLIHILGGIDERGLDTSILQPVHLVLHQGDQGRYDDGQTVQKSGRNLIADGLASPGRHNTQAVLPIQDGLDQILLTRTKGLISKIPLQRLLCILDVHHGSPVYCPGRSQAVGETIMWSIVTGMHH